MACQTASHVSTRAAFRRVFSTLALHTSSSTVSAAVDLVDFSTKHARCIVCEVTRQSEGCISLLAGVLAGTAYNTEEDRNTLKACFTAEQIKKAERRVLRRKVPSDGDGKKEMGRALGVAGRKRRVEVEKRKEDGTDTPKTKTKPGANIDLKEMKKTGVKVARKTVEKVEKVEKEKVEKVEKVNKVVKIEDEDGDWEDLGLEMTKTTPAMDVTASRFIGEEKDDADEWVIIDRIKQVLLF